jgi:hypothetical protein
VRLAGFQVDRCMLGNRVHWNLYATDRADAQVLLANGAPVVRSVVTYRDGNYLLPARMAARFDAVWQGDALFVLPVRDSSYRPKQSSFDVLWQETVRQQASPDGAFTVQFWHSPGQFNSVRTGTAVIVLPDRVGGDAAELLPLLSAMRQAGINAEQATNERRHAYFDTRPGGIVRYFTQASGQRYVTAFVLQNEGSSQ